MLIHTKPVFLLVLPFALVGIMVSLKPERPPNRWLPTVAQALVPIFLAFILCLPWGIRNYLIHKTVVPVCTVACWHLVCASMGEKDLLAKAMIEYVYAPEREGFAEGDYFREGMDMSRKEFMANPLRVTAAGAARLVAGWTPWPPYRVFLPHAYLFPLKFKEKYLFPLPDFEGLLYLFLFAVIYAAVARRRQLTAATVLWLSPSTPVLAIVIGYALAHIIAIPLVQYRFVMEPVCVVLGVGFCAGLFGMTAERRAVPYQAWMILVLTAALSLIALAPFFIGKQHRAIDYSTFMASTTDALGFEELRKLQWRASGSLPAGTNVSMPGVVRHLKPDWSYPPNERFGIASPGAAAARLYVRLNATDTPLGTGEVRLNFKSGPLPMEGEAIIIHGQARTGTYKDLIIDVDTWRQLPAKR